MVYISKLFKFPPVAEPLMHFHHHMCTENFPSLPCLHYGSPLKKTTKSDLFPVWVQPYSLFFMSIFCRFSSTQPCLDPSMFVICLKVSTLQTLSSPNNITFSMIKPKWSHMPLCSTIIITFLVSMAVWAKEVFRPYIWSFTSVFMSVLMKNILLV